MRFLKLFENFFLNESRLVLSDKLINLLKSVDSPVSAKILEIEKEGKDDLSITNNYFDLGEDKNKLSYTSDRKAQEILNTPESERKDVVHTGSGFLRHSDSNNDIFQALDYTPEGPQTYHPSSEEVGTIISHVTAPSGKIYCKVKFPGGISVINNQSLRFVDLAILPFKKSRQPGRVGATFQTLIRQIGGEFSNTEIQDFVNKYAAQFDKLNDAFRNFELVSGPDIYKWYQYTNYLHGENKGQLSSSCMRRASRSWLEIYTENPDVCSLLILKDDSEPDKIKGRALVWKLSYPVGITFVDRIYTHDDTDLELYKEYVAKQNWHLKKRYTSSTSDTNMIAPDGGEIRPTHLTVKVKPLNYGGYPYLDTLKFYTPSSGKLSTETGEYQLEDTGGSYVNQDCEYCGGDGYNECGECYGRGNIRCSECDNGRLECPECEGEGSIQCSTCDGSGGDASSDPCPDCNGDGVQACPDCQGDGNRDCPDCDGNGRVECEECGGEGQNPCSECNW